jgi:ferredoxin-NADP reductase
MPVPSYTSICLRNDCIARDIYAFTLCKPEGLSFSAGQFVLFDVPLIENPLDIQTRAFSIASAPGEPDLLFVAKMKEGGRASRWIAEVLQAGMTVRMQGPFGAFQLKDENPKDYLFVCTSTGVAPMRSQLLWALQDRKDPRRMDLLFGVRGKEDIFWEQELLDLSRTHENFHLHIALSAAPDDWTGHRGRVQAVLPQIAPSMAGKQIYICGNPAMTLELKKMCLERWSMKKEDVHVEGYI